MLEHPVCMEVSKDADHGSSICIGTDAMGVYQTVPDQGQADVTAVVSEHCQRTQSPELVVVAPW